MLPASRGKALGSVACVMRRFTNPSKAVCSHVAAARDLLGPAGSFCSPLRLPQQPQENVAFGSRMVGEKILNSAAERSAPRVGLPSEVEIPILGAKDVNGA